jgi:hypothetical protein
MKKHVSLCKSRRDDPLLTAGFNLRKTKDASIASLRYAKKQLAPSNSSFGIRLSIVYYPLSIEKSHRDNPLLNVSTYEQKTI